MTKKSVNNSFFKKSSQSTGHHTHSNGMRQDSPDKDASTFPFDSHKSKSKSKSYKGESTTPPERGDVTHLPNLAGMFARISMGLTSNVIKPGYV